MMNPHPFSTSEDTTKGQIMSITETVSLTIPRFLVGRARTQWKGVLVRNTPVEQASIAVFAIEDVMGELTRRAVEFELAA